MPRGVKKNIDFTNELQEITNKISRHQAQIEQLEKRRASIMEQKRQSDAARLISFLDQNGFSVDTAIALLTPSTATA